MLGDSTAALGGVESGLMHMAGGKRPPKFVIFVLAGRDKDSSDRAEGLRAGLQVVCSLVRPRPRNVLHLSALFWFDHDESYQTLPTVGALPHIM